MKKGFTLIELLVVIAIIGMLSAVVLGWLGSARGKGGNAGVKANLSNVRSQAELVNNNTGSYTAVCADATVVKILDAASLAGAANTTSDICNSTTGSWAASAPLKTAEGANNYWCVDNTGVSKGEAAALGAATVCS